MGDHTFFVSSFLRIFKGDYPINRGHYAEIYRKIVDDGIFIGDGINRINRRHYIEIYRKLYDDEFFILADELKTKLGLTVEEIEGATGPDFWARADKAVEAKKLAYYLREQTPPSSRSPARHSHVIEKKSGAMARVGRGNTPKSAGN
ncbi:hypothetical protein CASFOL_040744 [Castilleja foliolosa]|uniref:Uncharacterized protein n=1 Tax=Castilleja foliolosa TaxID=1961234 RepID=A0ABD3BCG2_9LAMI